MRPGNEITAYEIINILDTPDYISNATPNYRYNLGNREKLLETDFRPWIIQLKFGPHPFPCYDFFNIVKAFASKSEAEKYGDRLLQEQPYKEHIYLIHKTSGSGYSFADVFADMRSAWNYIYFNECRVLFRYGVVMKNDIICDVDIEDWSVELIPMLAKTYSDA